MIVEIQIRTRIIVVKHIRRGPTKPGASMSCRTVPKARKAEKPRNQWPAPQFLDACQICCYRLPNYLLMPSQLLDAYAVTKTPLLGTLEPFQTLSPKQSGSQEEGRSPRWNPSSQTAPA